MKKLISFIIICTLGLSLSAQDPAGPPPQAGGQQMKQIPDIFIPLETKNTSLIFRVNNRDGRLYQSWLGPKPGSIDNLRQMRDAGHSAYATFGTDNLFEPAIRATHND
ncbi:MAG: alpha-galactosidase, partial [Bacteroidetes bacterium]|nr:alpha-galactosidase [Bacteroidota bacterium]